MLHCNRDSGGTDKGRATGQHFKHHYPKRVQVRRSGKSLTPGLLRREIIGSAQHDAAIGQSCIFRHTDYAEVCEFDQETAYA